MATSKITLINEMIIRCIDNIITVIIDIQGNKKVISLKGIQSITVYDRDDHYYISVFAYKKINNEQKIFELKFRASYLGFDGMGVDFDLADISIIDSKTIIKKYWYWSNRKNDVKVKKHQYVNFYQIEKIQKPSNFFISSPAFVK